MTTDQASKPPLLAKLSFGLGYPVENIVLRSFELFILFYYTQVLGLSGALTGLALALAMVFDAVLDPAIGAWSDNLRNARFGRRHTFMFLSAIPLGVGFALVFLPPDGLGGMGLFAWLTVTAIVTRFSCGLFLVPYSAQFAEMTRDPEVRASLTIYKAVTMAIFDLLVVSVAFGYFFNTAAGDRVGQADPASYPPFALTFGITLALITLASGLGTYRFMRKIEASQVLPPAERLTFRKLAGNWKQVLLGARNVRIIVFAALVSVLASGTIRTLTSHMGVYFWELSPIQIAHWQQAQMPGMLLGLFVCRFILRRFELLHMLMAALAVQFAMAALLPTLRLTGILPVEADAFVPWLLVGTNFISGFGDGFVMMLIGMLCAEAADEAEYRTGVPQQGVIFGFIFLSIKTGSAVSKIISGTALDLMQFPKGAKSISPEMQTNLGLLVIAVAVILGSTAIYLYSRFSLRRAEHARMVAAIRERDSAARTLNESTDPKSSPAPVTS